MLVKVSTDKTASEAAAALHAARNVAACRRPNGMDGGPRWPNQAHGDSLRRQPALSGGKTTITQDRRV